MARRKNYAFERNQRSKAKAAKREAKREAKAAARAERLKAVPHDSEAEEATAETAPDQGPDGREAVRSESGG